MADLSRTDTFHRKKKDIPKIISRKTGDDEIIYGATAINKQTPKNKKYLQESTVDFDVFSNTPKKDAKEVELALDKHFGGDYFDVEAAQHPGTWKVKGPNGKTYADYTDKPRRTRSKTIDGKKYVPLPAIARHINKTLKDDTAKYRWRKDRDALNRIKLMMKKGGDK